MRTIALLLIALFIFASSDLLALGGRGGVGAGARSGGFSRPSYTAPQAGRAAFDRNNLRDNNLGRDYNRYNRGYYNYGTGGTYYYDSGYNNYYWPSGYNTYPTYQGAPPVVPINTKPYPR